MRGINQRPLPAGDVSVHPNGHVTVSSAGGRLYELRSNGTLASFQSQGHSASYRPDGHLSAVHKPTLDIRYNVNGSRTIITQRPDKTVLVGTGPRTGYLERSVVLGSRTFIQRTFVSGRATYTRTFTTYFYHGIALEHFVPALYFAPAFYGWAYYPWDTPVPYTWEWVGDPWYAFYNRYFTPYTSYPSGFAWLTDYFLARTLADAYQQQMQAPYDAGTAGDAPPPEEDEDTVGAQSWTPITPELKAAITEEVQHQLAYENAASTDTLPPDVGELPSALKPDHVFVVASNLDVTTAEQQACGLSPGDVLQLTQTPSEYSPVAALRVASSKRADCPAGVQITVSLQDLQDMQNNMRAQIDSGLQELRSRQGAAGLPSAPQSAVAPLPRPVLMDGPPDPSVDVASLLDSQQREAIQAEAGITQTVFVDQPAKKP